MQFLENVSEIILQKNKNAIIVKKNSISDIIIFFNELLYTMVVDGQRLVNFFDHPIKIKLPKDMVFFSKIINFIYE